MHLPPVQKFRYVGLIAMCCLNTCISSPNGTTQTPGEITSDAVYSEASGTTCKVTVTERVKFVNHGKDPIYVDFVLRNDRDVSIVLNHAETSGDIFMTLTNYLDGQLAARTEWGKQHYGYLYEFTYNRPIEVAAHSNRFWRYNLRDYYDLDHSGFYCLSARRTVDGTDGKHKGGGLLAEVNVGPIYFQVVEESK